MTSGDTNRDSLDGTKNAEIPDKEELLHYTLKIHKNFKISIYKPLIPLKLALFCWFSAGAGIYPFLSVFLKQRGFTLAEFSTVNIISPIVQMFGPTLAGIIADKLGRSKPILVGNILLNLMCVIVLLLIPKLNESNNSIETVQLKCNHPEYDKFAVRTGCNVFADVMKMEHCNVSCPENIEQYCHGQNLVCELLAKNEESEDFLMSVHINGTFKLKNQCYHNVSAIIYKNDSYSWCDKMHQMPCSLTCIFNSNELTSFGAKAGIRQILLAVNMGVLILFFTTFSIGYRIMDVTSMSLVKEHNSDFGRERFFSILGILIFSPAYGLVVEMSSTKGAERNYDSAFYLYIILIFFTLATIYKLKVRIEPPGKDMWKKFLTLIKNLDFISFVIVLFILGTAWAFTKLFSFWYLEGLNASSLVLGLLPAMGSLYGLPFLISSNWWVKKIGTVQIFLLAFLGYVTNAIGYSFLYDPWLSLILETTTILTYHLLWVAVVEHSHQIAPEGLTATIICSAGAIHYSVGKTSGSLIGGLVMNAFGGRKAYRLIAIICSISTVLYGLYLYARRKYYRKKIIMHVKEGGTKNEIC